MLDRDDISQLSTDELRSMGLSTETLTVQGVALIGYQRTKQVSRASRKAWEAGDTNPMVAEATARRAEIIEGAFAEIWREYLPVRDYLISSPPKHVLDIGCGAGINDVFLSKDFAPQFTLVDIEDTPEQYHFWSSKGAGYASLESARALLEENGTPSDEITTINPKLAPTDFATYTPDLVTSLYSCGFHYPINAYLDLMLGTLGRGGAVVLDLRARYLGRRPDPLDKLLKAGTVTTLYEDRKSVRIAVRA